MIDRAQEDAYLKGASQYNLEEANIELSGSVLTDDWARAGYRDTVGKLTIADEEAKLAAQMANLRTKPPEEFQKYLDKRRPKMLDSIQGMSAEQRQASLGKLIANDVAASSSILLSTLSSSLIQRHRLQEQSRMCEHNASLQPVCLVASMRTKLSLMQLCKPYRQMSGKTSQSH
jgi:hypothetical protein